MLCAVLAVCHIFQGSRLDIAEISRHLPCAEEILPLVEMPQCPLAQAELLPVVDCGALDV